MLEVAYHKNTGSLGRLFSGQMTYLPTVIRTDTRKVGHVGRRVGTSGTREDDPRLL